jgi:hypothetical protein
MFEVIHSMYDPERDAGPVTWVDMQLVTVIERLQDKILELERRLETPHDVTRTTDIMSTMSPADFVALEADVRRHRYS